MHGKQKVSDAYPLDLSPTSEPGKWEVRDVVSGEVHCTGVTLDEGSKKLNELVGARNKLAQQESE